jgi:ubiquinone/menaquinone biosynthesis C-methylase UbiE
MASIEINKGGLMNTFERLYHHINHYLLRKDTQLWVSPVFLRHMKRYQFASQHLAGRKVLDVACGTGYDRDVIADTVDNIDYTGVDVSEKCIKYARANYSGNYIHASIYTMPFSAESFDTIISFETIEHLKYPINALQLMFRLLRQGGRLIVSIPMNHPDRIYHKEVYTYSRIQELSNHIASTFLLSISEYHQIHLTISPIVGKLDDNSRGTYIGILEKSI